MIDAKKVVKVIFLLFACLTFSGCAAFRQASNDMGKWESDPLVPPMTAPVDLVSLLSGGARATDSSTPFTVQFEREVTVFNASDANTLVQRRNLIQDRMKVSADQLCDDYKANIMRKQARANFWLGTTSLFLGSAGALAKGVDAARALAGGAAFTTGMRSEYNQDFYLDQTLAVIAKAIDQRQREIYGTAEAKRAKPLTDYSVIQAIDDISRYHAACSMAGALSLTEKAVQSYNVVKAVEEAVKANNEFKKLGAQSSN